MSIQHLAAGISTFAGGLPGRFAAKTILTVMACALAAMTASCWDDNIAGLMRDEADWAWLETVYSDRDTNLYFNISDTGQSTVYRDGDDGAYINVPNAIRFEVYDNIKDSDDIVKDSVTGLIWTKCTMRSGGTVDTDDNCANVINADQISWTDAKSFCANLAFAGFDDWRLPDATEIFTIVVPHSGSKYGIDSSAFPNLPHFTGSFSKLLDDYIEQPTSYNASMYWTSSTGFFLVWDFPWGCEFNVQDTQNVLRLHGNYTDPDEYCYVRCVRGPD